MRLAQLLMLAVGAAIWSCTAATGETRFGLSVGFTSTAALALDGDHVRVIDNAIRRKTRAVRPIITTTRTIGT